MDSFENLWGDQNFEFNLEEPDEEFETPEVAPQFDYDANDFYTEEVFHSHEELFNWAQRTANALGYVLIKRRTNCNSDGVVNKMTLMCNLHGGKDRRLLGLVTRSVKIDCPFRLDGRLKSDGGWTVNIIDPRHNHYSANNLEGYAYARRMSEAEKSFVEAEYQRGTDPRHILKRLKDEFPGNLSRKEDIHNFLKTLRKRVAEKHGETPMQVMFSLLQEQKYLYYYTTNSATGRLQNLFFIHPTSFELWRAFPWVIQIDATYKTNLYNMPLVEIVGVTSTNRTFSISYAFITSEQEHNYRWVLECLKSTLGEGFDVRVVLTDRDLALMKACKTVMPEAYHLLCRTHIWRNIDKHCMPAFIAQGKWGPFYGWWKKLYESRTLEEYTENEKDLKEKMGKDLDKMYKYLQKEWLSPYKEKFVSFWVDQHLNYRNYTTNRVEAEHSLLKSELKGRCTFYRIIQCVNSILVGQHTEIKGQLEASRIYRHGKHNYPCLKDLLCVVSVTALDIMIEEIDRFKNKMGKDWRKCGCKVRASCGLPCACQIASYMHHSKRVEVENIDCFWRKLDLTPSTCLPDNDNRKDSDDDECINDLVEDVRVKIKQQPKAQRKNWISKIKDIVYPGRTKIKDPSVIKNKRGRPIGAKKKIPQVPDINIPTANTAPSGLQKSKSVQFSRPTFKDTQSMGGFSDRFSHASLFGEGQYGRHSEYMSTQSRFFEEPESQPQWPDSGRHSEYVGTSSIFADTASLFEEPQSQPQWPGSGRQSEYVDTEARIPATINIFDEPYNQPQGQYGRHSEYVVSDSRFPDTQSFFGEPNNQTQGETSSFVDQLFGGSHTQNFSEPVTHNFFETESTWTDMRTYLHQLPFYFQRYVVDIKNVSSDGNCGFRALAVALGESEEKFEWIRKLMLEEYESKLGYYEVAFGGEATRIHTLLQISYPHGRPYEHWMMIPYCAMLLSNALGLIIICLSVKENITCFPFWKGPGQLYRDEPICIGLVSGNSHFVTVSLDKDCPLPYPSAWGFDKPASRAWAVNAKYKVRLADYDRHIQATKAPPQFQQID